MNNEYYENLEKRTNLYSNDPSKMKYGKINYQEFVQNAIEATLEKCEVNSFEDFRIIWQKNITLKFINFQNK